MKRLLDIERAREGRSEVAASHAKSRRSFLADGLLGLGSLALTTLMDPLAVGAAPLKSPARWRGIVDPPHSVPRAKRVIQLYMAGGPSQYESFDSKPKLAQMHREPMPESFTQGQQIAQLQGEKLICMGPQFPFTRYGQSGQEICTIFPHVGSVADDICIIRSMQTDQINHAPAHVFMNTGTTIAGRPSLGSWLLYGLGTENENLPGYVVLVSTQSNLSQPISSHIWQSGFLSGRFEGVRFHSKGAPVHYLRSPYSVAPDLQRDVIDTVRSLDELAAVDRLDSTVEARIAQYEKAFRMQTSVPELTDLSDEPQHVFNLYGANGTDGSFASNCLMARRMAERGVRFVQVIHRGWDHHSAVKDRMESVARTTDRASAALVMDLKQRGMLDDTLVIWGGEFGRTPMAQADGRDHHIHAFSIWMAGAGIAGGMTYGATDELGYYTVENPVHVHDLHATMLHLLGIDHERLTYRYRGRDFRLTDVHGRVVHPILS